MNEAVLLSRAGASPASGGFEAMAVTIDFVPRHAKIKNFILIERMDENDNV